MTDTVRTAVITGWGEAPSVHDLPAPHEAPGRSLVRLVAAAVNPVDLAIGSGRFYMPLPEPPFTAGVEAVGHVVQSHSLAPGSLVWCLRPDGAFYVYCDVSGVCDDSFALAHRLLHEAHVALTPGRDFGFNRPDEHVRIAYTQDIPRLREACARIRAALA